MPESAIPPEDGAALVQLGAAYCVHVDGADVDGLRALLCEDVVLEVRDQVIAGRPEVIDFLVASRRGTHVATPPVLRRAGGTVTGHARFHFLAVEDGSLTAGSYLDEYRQVDGRWLLARRRIVIT